MKKKYIFYTLVILILTSYFFVNQSIGNKASIFQKVKVNTSKLPNVFMDKPWFEKSAEARIKRNTTIQKSLPEDIN